MKQPTFPVEPAAMQMAKQQPAGRLPTLVLDTNIWLAWLVFQDPESQVLEAAHHAGLLTVVASATGRAELAEVIALGSFSLTTVQQAQCLSRFDTTAEIFSVPAPSTTQPISLRCTDKDDQQFLELAVAVQANYLLSRDRAVLKLARRARRDYRFDIMTLAAWNTNQAK